MQEHRLRGGEADRELRDRAAGVSESVNPVSPTGDASVHSTSIGAPRLARRRGHSGAGHPASVGQDPVSQHASSNLETRPRAGEYSLAHPVSHALSLVEKRPLVHLAACSSGVKGYRYIHTYSGEDRVSGPGGGLPCWGGPRAGEDRVLGSTPWRIPSRTPCRLWKKGRLCILLRAPRG